MPGVAPCLQPGAVRQMARDQALHHLQHQRDQSDCAASGKRNGIGGDSTRCRTGTNGMTWLTKVVRGQ